jgi:hypothetical protein
LRYVISLAARADFRRLSKSEKQLFREAVAEFNAAAERFIQTGDPTSWPSGLRVKRISSAPGLFEMTWSFSGPEGRATWEWTTVAGEDGKTHPAVRWRRIGGHRVFDSP